ncbi:MAG: hypothetical protein FJX54_13795, partial [Alphaproteobacteria bacterium]|nr:hypothetical protein [Alphaproteobacteria bacterium]
MILIATCRAWPEPTPSIRLLIDALEARGAKAELRIWTDTPAGVFAAADLVLPLCTWDYHADPQRFAGWIDELEQREARLLNAPQVLRWNFRKTYLLEMAAHGLAVPRTLHLLGATRETVAAAMEQEGWRTAILKPVSSQSGHGVRKLDIEDEAAWRLDGNERLLQAFQPDIGIHSESTLTFIDGAFSHAVRRRRSCPESFAHLIRRRLRIVGPAADRVAACSCSTWLTTPILRYSA